MVRRYAHFTVTVFRILLCVVLFTHIANAQVSSGETLLAQYGALRTIAGLSEGEDANFWKAEFEGAKAREIELSNPHMTMADPAGNYYISNKESHSILKVDPSGVVTTFAGTHESGYNNDLGNATEIMLHAPNRLHVFPDSTVFILDFFDRRVRRGDVSGTLTTMFETHSFGPDRALWVNPSEDLIYVNGPDSVHKWTPTGGLEVAVSNLPDPGNLTVDPNGNLVVTTRSEHLVYRVHGPDDLEIIAGNDTDVEVPLGGVPTTEVGLEWPRGVAFPLNGTLFIATQKGGDVWYVDSKSIIHPFVKGRRSGNERSGKGQRFNTPGDKIRKPRAVSMVPNGDIIITSNDKDIIRIVKRFQIPTLCLQRTSDDLKAMSDLVASRPYHL